jgi:ParB/RepB/Spo0J family partition protein
VKTWDKAVLLPIDSLVLTDWNCNELQDDGMASLLEDIQQGGFDEPIHVVPIKDDRYLVIGGEHRTKALRSLDVSEVPAIVRHDLAHLDRKELILWSVRRNHTRGKVNEQKYAKLEQELIDQHNMTTEAARRSMLVNGELAKALKRREKKLRASDDEPDDETSGGKSDREPPTEAHKEARRRESVLQSLKTAEEEVLLQSEDTVQHGYLFFAQQGKLHLVVDTTKHLHVLVQRMVDTCKGESASVDEFLASAISKELKSWE